MKVVLDSGGGGGFVAFGGIPVTSPIAA